MRSLAELRLVRPEDSDEFFSPPLPYLLPALLISLTGMKVFWAAKLAQCVNFLLSLGLTLYLVKACELIKPQSSLKFGSLFFLGMLPAYYKTFAFVRGEPYVVFFAVVVLYHVLLMSVRERFSTATATILGAAMGLCSLSRQWGILLFPPVFMFLGFEWVRLPQWRYAITKTICLCFVLILVVSGWFYSSLHLRYGSMTAFNRKPATHFSLNNQPLDFYFGLSPKSLFENPIRPNFK